MLAARDERGTRDRGRSVVPAGRTGLIMVLGDQFYPDAQEQSMIVDPRNREDVSFFFLSFFLFFLSLHFSSNPNGTGRHFSKE